MDTYMHPTSGETYVIGEYDGRKLLLGPVYMAGDPPVPHDVNPIRVLTDELVASWAGNLMRDELDDAAEDYRRANIED